MFSYQPAGRAWARRWLDDKASCGGGRTVSTPEQRSNFWRATPFRRLGAKSDSGAVAGGATYDQRQAWRKDCPPPPPPVTA